MRKIKKVQNQKIGKEKEKKLAQCGFLNSVFE